MGIGKNIKKRLDEKNMSVNELATKASISPQTLYAIIKRDKPDQKVSPDILQRIADVLQVDPMSLSNGIVIIQESKNNDMPKDILNAFGDFLTANQIKYKVCMLNGVSGKLFAFGQDSAYEFFLTDEQARQLPEMSIEQIKALIRSFNSQNKRD